MAAPENVFVVLSRSLEVSFHGGIVRGEGKMEVRFIGNVGGFCKFLNMGCGWDWRVVGRLVRVGISPWELQVGVCWIIWRESHSQMLSSSIIKPKLNLKVTAESSPFFK